VYRVLGEPPGPITIPISSHYCINILNTVVDTRKNLPLLVEEQISPSITMHIKEAMSIDHFLIIAYVIEGELFGTSIIGIQQDQPNLSKKLLESFAYIVAISLRRSHAETTLHESENRLRSFIEHMLEGVSIVDSEGRIIEWNPAQE
jgi:PAS domain-containing protein